MPRFNKKAPIKIGAERISICLAVLSERWTLWIQVMFPSNASLPKPEHIFILNRMHFVHNVMTDLRLQFSDEPLKHAHFDNGHESGLLQSPAVASDGREVMIDGRKVVVRPEFSSKMVPSQVCLQTGEVGQGSIRVNSRALPAHLIAGTQAGKSVKSKLGHYPRTW